MGKWWWLGLALLAMAAQAKGASAMKKQFADPPAGLRPLQIVHGMEGLRRVGEGDLGRGLDALVARGMGGVVANVAFGDEYLRSEPAWQTFLKGYRAARARDLAFWIYDEDGYPSGAAGTLTLAGNPEYEACGLTCLQAAVAPGETGVIELPARSRSWVAACAVAAEGTAAGQPVPVPADRSAVRWTNDTGRPQVLFAFPEQTMYEDTHCTTNVYKHRPYINILDRGAVAKYIRLTHDAYAKRLGDELRHVQAFFTDEPSLMFAYMPGLETPRPPALPWERTLAAEFEQKCGYPLALHLPALFTDRGDDSRRVRSDFWRVVSERVADSFYGQIQDRCRQLGVPSSGHALCEERLGWHVAFEGDYFRALRRMDWPGIDILDSDPGRLIGGDGFMAPKVVSSIAHLLGAPRVMSETSDHVQRMGKDRASVDQMIATAALQYALGVDLITSYYQWGGYGEEYQVSWLRGRPGVPADGYRQWADTVGRLGVLMVGGRHRCDIAVYYPIETAHAYFEPTDQAYWAQGVRGERVQQAEDALRDATRVLLCSQNDLDLVDAQAVTGAAVKHGRLAVGQESYRALVFAGARVTPPAVLRQALALQRAGGRVIFLGGLPTEAPRPEDDGQVATLARELAAAGAAVITKDLDARPALPPPAVSLFPATMDIVACRREKDGRQLCLLVNYTPHPVSFRATIQGLEGKAELWWPDTGQIEAVPNLPAHTITLKGYQPVAIVR